MDKIIPKCPALALVGVKGQAYSCLTLKRNQTLLRVDRSLKVSPFYGTSARCQHPASHQGHTAFPQLWHLCSSPWGIRIRPRCYRKHLHHEGKLTARKDTPRRYPSVLLKIAQ